jgi:hypothetical protein
MGGVLRRDGKVQKPVLNAKLAADGKLPRSSGSRQLVGAT